MSNYLDYETTKLLPENPYNNYPPCWWILANYIDNEEPFLTGSGSIAYDADGMLAWTWEDVRLYLDEKGYIIEITYDSGACGYIPSIYNKITKEEYYYSSFNTFEKYGEDVEYGNIFTCFETARLTAIHYCLHLINDENTRTDTE
jgi:hypothetical protein